jgi:hypothetical protein
LPAVKVEIIDKKNLSYLAKGSFAGCRQQAGWLFAVFAVLSLALFQIFNSSHSRDTLFAGFHEFIEFTSGFGSTRR